MMPEFTEPKTIELLRAGASEERIVELVGPPWRRLPASQGELWVWEMDVFDRHVLLAINVVGGFQRGDAIAEWRIIPDWMLHHSRLDSGMELSRVVDALGTPTRWEVVAGESCMVWESAVQFMQQDGSWIYAPETYLHSLRLKVVDDRLRSVVPIESRKLDGWPRTAAQQAAVGEGT